MTTKTSSPRASPDLHGSRKASAAGASIEGVTVSAFTIPTATPESDGTLTWDATTLVLVEAEAGGMHGMGYTCADAATARLIYDLLIPIVTGRDALDVPGARRHHPMTVRACWWLVSGHGG